LEADVSVLSLVVVDESELSLVVLVPVLSLEADESELSLVVDVSVLSLLLVQLIVRHYLFLSISKLLMMVTVKV
ncbi:hypothetical protein, partial [Enterococcus faecium]|uniref:hypothetical protein n=1 Tax=Enterococcus faecium TaxID=1352 RepID=UPI000DFEDC37